MASKSSAFYVGVGLLCALAFIALAAPIIAPYDPNAMGTPYLRPSGAHWLGTNDVGQDILSELIYGSRVSLFIGLASSVVMTLVGTTVGLLAGYLGGIFDRMLMALTSLAMAIPMLPLTIVLVAFLGASLWNIIIAICITAWTTTARIIRSRVVQIKALPFVKIEQTFGLSPAAIMFRHILPNMREIVFVRGVLAVAGAMMTEAGLSFLGLGVLGTKSWGGTLHYAFFRNGISNGYVWWYLPPIVLICLSVLTFMLLSQAAGHSQRRLKEDLCWK